MISKAQIKRIVSLQQKKHREAERLFTAEGTKIAIELLHSPMRISKIYATAQWFAEHDEKIPEKYRPITEEVTERELDQISALKTPQPVLLVVEMPDKDEYTVNKDSGIHLAVERIQDPGNLGTIIRLADWYGLEEVICSPECVDAYNPKTVQASMGSIGRVRIITHPLDEILPAYNLLIWGATLDGEHNAHNLPTGTNGILLIGNEGAGLSDAALALCSHTIRIPSYGQAESLNAALATGILLDNFMRVRNG